MAEDSELERTEQPSQRRLEQAREEGQIVRSPELTTLALLMAGASALWFGGPQVLAGFKAVVRDGLTFGGEVADGPSRMFVAFERAGTDALIVIAPVLGVLLLAALLAPLLLSGWAFSTKPLMPDFSRLSPAQGLGRILSKHGLVELAKALAKVTLIGVVTALVLRHYAASIPGLARQPLEGGLADAARTTGMAFMLIAAAMLLIAAIDVPFQFWQHHTRLRMSLQDLKQEARESDGDPHVKAAIRLQQRAAARRRMMADVPKADVIVTNPTHYAVAIGYRDDAMRAPKVLAKGAELLAAKIREVGVSHGIPILEAPALARALYAHTPLGAEIPEKLYMAVAEVMAHVYRLRHHRELGLAAPQALAAPAVPKELDPLTSPAEKS